MRDRTGVNLPLAYLKLSRFRHGGSSSVRSPAIGVQLWICSSAPRGPISPSPALALTIGEARRIRPHPTRHFLGKGHMINSVLLFQHTTFCSQAPHGSMGGARQRTLQRRKNNMVLSVSLCSQRRRLLFCRSPADLRTKSSLSATTLFRLRLPKESLNHLLQRLRIKTRE